MALYNLSKEERIILIEKINQDIVNDLSSGKPKILLHIFKMKILISEKGLST